MTKIEHFNKFNYPQFETALLAAMQKIGAEFGVTVEIGQSKISSTEATIVVRAQSALGEQLAAKTWDLLAEQFGFPKGKQGKQFIFNGKVFTAVSLSSERIKYPMTGENANGKRFKFPAGNRASYKWVD
jgi:hypothetical protein